MKCLFQGCNDACDYENVKDVRQHHEEALLYSTVRVPTNPPDPHMIYSTVQLPTMPSDDVMYAAVSFHKNDDSDATVTFGKEEILTEYAIINRNKRLNWKRLVCICYL